MPRTFTICWLTPSTIIQPDGPSVEEPPAAALATPTPAVILALVLQVGDYQVGEGFCSALYGHPDIRY